MPRPGPENTPARRLHFDPPCAGFQPLLPRTDYPRTRDPGHPQWKIRYSTYPEQKYGSLNGLSVRDGWRPLGWEHGKMGITWPKIVGNKGDKNICPSIERSAYHYIHTLQKYRIFLFAPTYKRGGTFSSGVLHPLI